MLDSAPQSETSTPVEKKLEGRARSLANLMPPARKGEVRNPRGRPKKDLDLAKLAQQHAEKAIQTLANCLTEETASWPAKVSAASELLDRGFGRSPQSLDVKHEIGFSEQFEDFIRSMTERKRAKCIDAEEIISGSVVVRQGGME